MSCEGTTFLRKYLKGEETRQDPAGELLVVLGLGWRYFRKWDCEECGCWKTDQLKLQDKDLSVPETPFSLGC